MAELKMNFTKMVESFEKTAKERGMFVGWWIPVSERLPEENVPVLLGIRFKDDFKYFVTVRMDVTYWSGIGRELKGTGYWMPLPEPYKAESEDKK